MYVRRTLRNDSTKPSLACVRLLGSEALVPISPPTRSSCLTKSGPGDNRAAAASYPTRLRPFILRRRHSPQAAVRGVRHVTAHHTHFPASRMRAPRHAGSAPARHSGSAEADAQASQEARISAEVTGHRQAALLRVGVPAIRAELPSRTGDQAQQSSRELSSAGATARAQGAAIQAASRRERELRYDERQGNLSL